MKQLLIFFMIFCMLFSVDVDARGGRGGGRGGGGRGGGGGRSPSMSRSRPSQRPSSRPSSRPTQRPSSRPTQRSAQRPAQRPSRGDIDKQLRSAKVPDRPQRSNRPDRGEMGDRVRDNFDGRHPDRDDWFDNNNWWKWATAGAVGSWVVNNWRNPVYYDYGAGGTIYTDDQWVDVEDSYAEEAEVIADSAPDVDVDSVEWLPLGVFALTSDDPNAQDTDKYIQLALSKDGVITGSYFNSKTDTSFPVEGMVDQESQRAAFKMVDSVNSPVIETGIYNLTKDETTALIHFPDGSTQTWLLVRIEE